MATSASLDAYKSPVRAYEDSLSDPTSDSLEALLARDRLQLSLSREGVSAEEAKRIRETDEKLKARMKKLSRDDKRAKAQLKRTVLPPDSHWWWQPAQEHLFWNIVSISMLATTGALAASFCALILTRNPDAWGVLAVVLQGSLTLVAGGAFTSAGQRLLDKLGLLEIAAKARACFSIILTLVVLGLWYFVPPALASRYDRLGLDACPSNLRCPNLPRAITMFERASSLDPSNATVHFNFGRAYELAFDFDNAIKQYQQAVQADAESPAALSNWARILLVRKKDVGLALALLDDAVSQADERVKNEPYQAAPSIYKNRGMANYELGFFSLAEADLTDSLKLQRDLSTKINGLPADIAAPHCLLSMVETRLKNATAALGEARICVKLNRTDQPEKGSAPKVDPLSIRFAQTLLQSKGYQDK